MNVKIPYGKETISVSISEPYNVVSPTKISLKNEKKIISDALENPFYEMSFEEFVRKSNKLLVIVNDATRPTPTSKILERLYPQLSAHPQVFFLVATGTHRPPTTEEFEYIFGKHYEKFKNQIISHDCRNKKDMAYLGKSKNGTEIYVNNLVVEYQNVIVIGSVEPHYFAGYTGGRKAFLPGVASYQTIEMNHKLALSDKAKTLSLKGNPVHEDMVDAVKLLKGINIFSIQSILTADHKIYAITAGDIHKSFDAAITYANQIFCVPLEKKANIVITAAPYPLDVDLYQSQKALENGKLALLEQGVIILVSKCRTGVGDTVFLEVLSSASSCRDVVSKVADEYKLGHHKAVKMAQIGINAEMWAVTDLDEKIIKKTQMKPYSSIQQAVDDAVKKIKNQGKKPYIVVMPFGSVTIPVFNA